MSQIILKDCRELLTIEKDAKDQIGLKKNQSILIEGEHIKRIGKYGEIQKEFPHINPTIIDCSNNVVLPGYVDSHTHLIFGKSRVDEYAASMTMSKEKIRKKLNKTGLDSSIEATKMSSDEELLKSSMEKLSRMLKSGTTTVEIKSGYGIDRETELRQLRLIRKLSSMSPQTILSTYLGAHYWDFTMGKAAYIKMIIKEILPVIQDEKLADFCDVWCDEGYYTAEESEQILSEALARGILPSLHTECYSAIGGAKVAAKLKAANAGHLNYLSEEDMVLMREAGVVGVLIPTTDFSVKHPTPVQARKIIDCGLDVAIATNMNPGNWIESMPIAMGLACRNHEMTAEEAIRAATWGGAKALKIEKMYGSIEEGKYADIQILHSDNYKNIIYKFGVNEIDKVVKKGAFVVE